MTKFTIYVAMAITLIAGRATAQESFEEKAKAIAEKIEKITKEEKEALRIEIEDVNKQLDNNSITKAQADEMKLKLAETRSNNIETRISQAEDELKELVKQKVDGKIREKYEHDRIIISFSGSRYKNKERYRKWRDSIAALGERRTYRNSYLQLV